MARPSEFHLGIATLLFAALTTALIIAEPFQYRGQPAKTLVIHAVEADGRVRVDWNPADVAAFNADSAVLRVDDGGALHEYPIDRATLENGGLDYIRKSGDVLLNLTLLSQGRPRTEVLVRTIVSQPAPGPQSQPAESRARQRY